MSAPGSTGNVIAALASLLIPGLGQLLQGRWIVAIIHLLLALWLWFGLLGWLLHLWSAVSAARFRAKP